MKAVETPISRAEAITVEAVVRQPLLLVKIVATAVVGNPNGEAVLTGELMNRVVKQQGRNKEKSPDPLDQHHLQQLLRSLL